MSKEPTAAEKARIAQLKDIETRGENLPGVSVKLPNDDPSKGELIVFFSFLAIGASAFGTIIWAGIKQEKKLEEEAKARVEAKKRAARELEEWITEQENSNKKVYRLQDGRYLTVDYQASQEIHVKKN